MGGLVGDVRSRGRNGSRISGRSLPFLTLNRRIGMFAVESGVRSGAVAARDRFSRKHDLVPRWTNAARRLGVSWPVSLVYEKVPARSPYSLCQTSSEALIYVKTSSDQRRKSVGALVELESRTIPVLREVGVIGRLREEQKHDQVDCCCWLRVIGCNIGASYDARADSSAGGYDHASRGRLRRWQDTS